MKYVDVNVFVYWLGDDPVLGGTATNIVERIEGGERAVTSTLTPWLTHVVLSALSERYSERELVKKFTGLPFLRLEPLTVGDYSAAVESMLKYGLDLEDGLHFAVAMRVGAEGIYTHDADFDKTPLKTAGFGKRSS